MRQTGSPVSTGRGRWWPPFLAGAFAGFLVSLFVRPRPGGAAGGGSAAAGGRDGGRPRWDRWREAWDDAVEGAADGLAGARDLVMGRPTVDLETLEGRLRDVPGFDGCRVRLLGEGIVEVVGSCGSEEEADAILDAVAVEPGVEVVVNRVWTPSSGAPMHERPDEVTQS